MEGSREEVEVQLITPPPSHDVVTKKKVFDVGILLAVNLLNYMDRFTIAGVLGRVQDYFVLNDTETGMLQYFYVFLLLRGIVGIGEATYSTIAPTIIGDIFCGHMRSIALMVFYFAIPVGSGLGFIGGSTVALWTGDWRWGVRFTPLLGVIFLVLIVMGLEEPKRGQAEHAQLESSTLLEDLKYLLRVPTYLLTTLGFTSVVFCVGAASWWAPRLMTYAYGILNGIDDVPKSEVTRISIIFGVITCCGGIMGIVIGSLAAQAWREGKWRLKPSNRADPFVCAAGSLFATPLLFLTLIVASHSFNVAWVFLFLGVTCMCLNWAINMDILMHVIISSRRASACAIQTLIGHLFGDASSPYIIGFISDSIRGDQTSSKAKYYALQQAMFLPNAILVLSIGCYLWATLHIVQDHHRARIQMHVEDEWARDVDDLITNSQEGYGDSVESATDG